MDEQPVALAIRARSPKSWDSNFKYGVSPQPAQAPENSNNGWSNCESLTWPTLISARSTSAGRRLRKKSQFAASCSRSGGWGTILMALRLVSLLFLAGQASTHKPQPVQSSGATWRVYAAPGNSFQRAGEVPKLSGAAERTTGSKTLARITACGHTSTHLLHWIHTAASHSGIPTAILRFSKRVVPLG